MYKSLTVAILITVCAGCAPSPTYYLSDYSGEDDAKVLWQNGDPYYQLSSDTLKYVVMSRSNQRTPNLHVSIENLTNKIIEINPTQIQCQSLNWNNEIINSAYAVNPADLIDHIDGQIQQETHNPFLLLDAVLTVTSIGMQFSGNEESRKSGSDYLDSRRDTHEREQRKVNQLKYKKTLISSEYLGRHSLLPFETVSGKVSCTPTYLNNAYYYSLRLPNWPEQSFTDFKFRLMRK